MIGVQVAVSCSSSFLECLGVALQASGETEQEAWERSFPGVPLQHCLMDSFRVFPVPLVGSGWSPNVYELTHGRMAKSFTIEEFAPQLFVKMREALGVSDQQLFN